MTPHRFIVPVKGVNTFCTFAGGQLCPENPLPQVGYGEHAIDDEFGWVAWPAEDGRTIGRTHLDATEGEGGFAPLVMPADYKAECLLFHRQVLFVGGNCGKEVLGSFDLASPAPEWVPLEVPDQFRRYGKRIDGLLLDGDRLIAVDNVVVPKYLLLYDVTEPRAARLSDVRGLLTHSPNETIRRAALGTDWIAILSHRFTRGGGGYVIGLLDRGDLCERGCLGTPSDDPFTREYSGVDPADLRTWRDVAFCRNHVLIAAGRHGVGVLDLGSLTRPATALEVNDWGSAPSRSAEHDRFDEACEAALRYVRPKGVAGPVARVVPVPGARQFLAVVEKDSGLDTVVMGLS